MEEIEFDWGGRDRPAEIATPQGRIPNGLFERGAAGGR